MADKPEMIVIRCPSCGHRMKAPAPLLGKATNCLKCGNKFQVTQEASAPLDAAGKPAAEPAAAKRRWAVGELLVQNGLVTAGQLKEAESIQAEQGGAVFEILIERGYLNKERFNSLMSTQPGIASIDLRNYRVNIELMTMVPKELVLERLALPIDRLGKLLTLAMVCPLDTDTIQEVSRITGLRVNPVLCDLDDIRTALERYLPRDRGPLETDLGLMPTTGLKAKEAEPPRPTVTAAPAPTVPVREAPPAPPREIAEEERGPREKVTGLLSELQVLPPAPETVARIQEAARDPHYAIRDLAVICSSDPALVARLLGVANAAAYGMPDRVDNANLAATLLGTAGTIKVVKALADAPPVSPAARFDYPAFLLRSRFCAAAAQAIARTSGKASPVTACTTGLLHKLGLLALAWLLPEEFGKLDPQLEGPARWKSEGALLGLSHPEAGHLLARNWRLPIMIARAISTHHSPGEATKTGPVAAVVALAARMAEIGIGIAPQDGFDQCREILDMLSLGASDAHQILKDTSTMFNP